MVYWMLMPLRRYIDLAGRSRRREYWLFLLFYAVVSAIAVGVDLRLGYGTTTRYAVDGIYGAGFSSWGPAEALVALVLLLPSVAVSVRRLHDTDRRGWWLLLMLVPIVGGIVLLVFFCLDGTRGPNRFGPDPKADPR